MKTKEQLITEVENRTYDTITEKKEADRIITNFIKAIEIIDLKKYKINVMSNPLRLTIKHKAFNDKINLFFKKGKFFLDEIPLQLSDIDNALHCYFELDKKI
jgi:hypothetical protein